MFKRPLLAALVLLSTSACVVGAPPGFSSGDLWTVPLVAPLENDLLLVPVSINDEGPFLFMVDPDSPTSSIESSLQAGMKLFASRSVTQAQTEDDHLVSLVFAEVRKLTVGTLSIRNMKLRVHDDATFWSGGRRVRGILGRDVISDSLIYSFDRDRGKMYIATQGNLKLPEGSMPLSFTQSYSAHRRYLANLRINRKHKVTMHLDLGARTSMLWPKLIKKYKMPTIPVQAELVDEYGSQRVVTSGTIAGIVEAKKTLTNALLLLPYSDKRLEPEDLDGIIGQNFWSRYNVTVNWHQKKFWMQPRTSKLAALAEERIGRWGDSLSTCADPACVKVTLVGGPAKKLVPEPAEAAPTEETTPAADVPATPTAEGAAAATPTTPAAGGAPPAPPAPAVPAAGPTSPVGAPSMAAVEAPQPMPANDKPYSLLIERAGPGTNFAYDVVVAAVDADGQLLNLPPFLASFRSGVAALTVAVLGPEYGEAASFVVLDMNPVGTRGCEGNQCVYALASMRPTQ
jgi:hypothetical protein